MIKYKHYKIRYVVGEGKLSFLSLSIYIFWICTVNWGVAAFIDMRREKDVEKMVRVKNLKLSPFFL